MAPGGGGGPGFNPGYGGGAPGGGGRQIYIANVCYSPLLALVAHGC